MPIPVNVLIKLLEDKMFKAYFYKLIRSPLFYIGIVGVAGICCLRLLPSGVRAADILGEVDLMRSLDGNRKMFVILAALPFAANFSDEWNCMITTGCVSRTGARKYAVTNVVMCYISALSAVFIGTMLFSLVYSGFYPMYRPGTGSDSLPYGIFTVQGFPMLDLAFSTFVFSANCAMWSVMGLMLTAFFPSKYIAICSPFVFSYAVERITLNFPDNLNLMNLSLSHMEMDALPAFLYSNAVFAVIAALCGIIFTIRVERRVRNGLN